MCVTPEVSKLYIDKFGRACEPFAPKGRGFGRLWRDSRFCHGQSETKLFKEFLCLIVICEHALSGGCEGGIGKNRLEGKRLVFEFHIPNLRYITYFVIFP